MSEQRPEVSKTTRVYRQQSPKEEWYPPSGSWENVQYAIDAVENDSSGRLVAYITWPNGRKIKLLTAVLCKKSPQRVRDLPHNKKPAANEIIKQILQYYERHAVFRPQVISEI